MKKYTHAEVMELVDEKTKSQKLMYEQEIQEIAYAVKIWPCDLQQLQWSPGGVKDAIIDRIEALSGGVKDAIIEDGGYNPPKNYGINKHGQAYVQEWNGETWRTYHP